MGNEHCVSSPHLKIYFLWLWERPVLAYTPSEHAFNTKIFPEWSHTILLPMMWFVFFTYALKPLIPDSQHTGRVIQICMPSALPCTSSSHLQDFSSSCRWILCWKLLLGTTAALHLPGKPVMCRSHRVQSCRGLCASFCISGKGPFCKGQQFLLCANVIIGNFHFTSEGETDWAAKLPRSL